LNELLERWGDQWPSEIAMVYAWSGDKDAAFQWLDKEIDVNGTYGCDQLAAIEFKVDLTSLLAN